VQPAGLARFRPPRIERHVEALHLDRIDRGARNRSLIHALFWRDRARPRLSARGDHRIPGTVCQFQIAGLSRPAGS
jgi:hypothetical protein